MGALDAVVEVGQLRTRRSGFVRGVSAVGGSDVGSNAGLEVEKTQLEWLFGYSRRESCDSLDRRDVPS